MTEWGVFLVIVALITFIVTVTTPIVKLNTTITKLNDSVNTLNESFKRFDESNTESHRRIWSKLEEHGEKLGEHEGRIKSLEDQ